MYLRTLALAFLALPTFAQLPSGYVDELVVDGLNSPVGVTHDANGRMYVWERRGMVWIVENGVKQEPELLDLRDEVGSWRDYGLLGFTLDPEFLSNGYVYAYYVVDRHHLLHAGTPNYDEDVNEYFNATIGRVTRFSADPSTGKRTVLEGSRHVLLGETADAGVPILHESHGTGAILFGSDGTLLLSSGDAASFNLVDAGSAPGTYWAQALADGIIREAENVGAFRSQMIGSLNGKVLRLDPETGDGIPSNPWFDPADPRAPRSRVWALGLRNPFRFTLRPGTGQSDPAAGDPGVLYVGDVGYVDWEELHVVAEPGMNLGWPIFEGLSKHEGYRLAFTQNQDAPNPLFDGVTCTQEFFDFQDLLKQEREDHSPKFKNPCDNGVDISPATPTYMHRRAAIEWRHQSDLAYVPTFENGKARRSALGDPSCPVDGTPFRGACSVGGVWLSGLGFGDPYKGRYFHADHTFHWIRAFDFEADDHLHEVFEFGALATPTYLAEDPLDGSLLYVQFSTNSVRRVRYTGDGNVAPVALASADAPYGASPRLVRLDGSASADPENGDLTFLWEFADGSCATSPSPTFLFDNPGGLPSVQVVELTVSDSSGATGQTQLEVHLDNTPPVALIAGVVNGQHYDADQQTTITLDAIASDAEHPVGALAYEWQLFLHHANHAHSEEVLTTQQAQFLLTPTPCSGEFYAYRVDLTVRDPEGAATTRSVWLLPDCDWNGSASITSPAAGTVLDPGDAVQVEVATTGAVDRVDLLVDGVLVGTDFSAPYSFPWTAGSHGTRVLTALVAVTGEGAVTSPGLPLDVRAPLVQRSAVERVRDDASESGYDQSVTRNGERLPLGLRGAEPFTTGLRLQLPVPAGAKILSARLVFTARERDLGLAQLSIAAEASDDAPTISSVDGDLSGRTRTAASTTWLPEWWRYVGARGARQTSPDLGAIVQELVDRPGWNAGQHALFLIDGFGQRRARAFQLGDLEGAELVIEYQ
ncbi:MAG: PQQ-dependent sugar dehydrogenase [Planctomycetota bacterium]|nr:PQQ-dependent sugar dehydrogenase [Planctomycetota bacterium]